MSKELLLAGPSVPNPTGTPASSSSGSGVTPPVASFRFETGQWTTPAPAWATWPTSAFVIQPQCASTVDSSRASSDAKSPIGRTPRFASVS